MTITVMWITIQILAQSLVRSQCPSNPQQKLLILAESQHADEVIVVGAFDRHEGLRLRRKLEKLLALRKWDDRIVRTVDDNERTLDVTNQLDTDQPALSDLLRELIHRQQRL